MTEEKENSQLNKALRNPRQRTKSRKILKVAMKRKRLLYLKKLKNKIQMWRKVDLAQLHIFYLYRANTYCTSTVSAISLHFDLSRRSFFMCIQKVCFYLTTRVVLSCNFSNITCRGTTAKGKFLSWVPAFIHPFLPLAKLCFGMRHAKAMTVEP